MLHHLKSSPAYAHHLAQGRCCSCTSSPPLRLKLVDMLVMSCREGIKIIKHPISSTSNDKWKWWWCATSWYHELIISNHVPWYHKFPPLNRVSMFPHTFRHVPIPSLCIPRHTWRGWWSFRSSCWLQTSAMAPVGPASGWNQKWPPLSDQSIAAEANWTIKSSKIIKSSWMFSTICKSWIINCSHFRTA